MTKQYLVTNAGQEISTINADSLSECHKHLLSCGYSESEVNAFYYEIIGAQGINAVPVTKEFEIVINTLLFGYIKPGDMFVTKQRYGDLGINAPIKVKLNESSCLNIEHKIFQEIYPGEEVYLVLINRPYSLES